MERKQKLVIFTTSFNTEMEPMKDLLFFLGKKKEAVEIHQEYEKRKLFGPYGLEKIAKLYEGNSIEKLRDLSLYYCKRNLFKGIKDFVSELKEKGMIVGMVSFDHQFILDAAKEEIKFDFVNGTEIEFENGIATGNILRKVDRCEQARILEERRKEFGISKENVIAFGNASIVHLPLIKQSNLFVGFDLAKDNFERIIKNIKYKFGYLFP